MDTEPSAESHVEKDKLCEYFGCKFVSTIASADSRNVVLGHYGTGKSVVVDAESGLRCLRSASNKAQMPAISWLLT